MAASLLVAMAASGCGPTRSSDPVLTQIPPTSATLRRGEQVFETHCYSCHQHGEGGMSPALNDKPLPQFYVRFQVRHGVGAMPGFSVDEISDPQLEDLARYVAALRDHSR